MSDMPPETTLALFAREDTRAKAPAACIEAVTKAGGQVVAQMTVKPWELAGWVREQAARMGISLDGAAAKALVDQVGQRQQRLLRELEKLALESEQTSGRELGGPEDIEARAAHSAEWQSLARWPTRWWPATGARRRCISAPARAGRAPAGADLHDGSAAARCARGRSAPAGRRVRRRGQARVAHAGARGRAFRQRSRAHGSRRLRRALGVLAELELDARGGAVLSFSRTARGPRGGHDHAAGDRAYNRS